MNTDSLTVAVDIIKYYTILFIIKCQIKQIKANEDEYKQRCLG